MKIIDGKLVSSNIKEDIKKEVAGILDAGLRAPHLVAVLVGDDPASETYVKNKEKACHSVGINSSVYKMPENTTTEELLKVITFLNYDDEVDGIIIQLPLPKQIDYDVVLETINPEKDVDGFHPLNVGKMVVGEETYLPATPFGILKLLEYYQIETQGKNCAIIGRSNIVGTPMSILLSRKGKRGDCTVTLCHSKTANMAEITRRADIVIVAIGKPKFLTADMVKQNAAIIDVGINRVPSDTSKTGYALVGDVDFEEVSKKADYITPVPGGVGPMTIIGLMLNTLSSYKKRINTDEIESEEHHSCCCTHHHHDEYHQ